MALSSVPLYGVPDHRSRIQLMILRAGSDQLFVCSAVE
jgi:hypothetical protein